jgi:flagellar motility protein MotE (MotC chaperone)
MKGVIKIAVLAVIALASFLGYLVLFGMVLGVNTSDAISVLTTGTVEGAPRMAETPIEADSTGTGQSLSKEAEIQSKADSLAQQLETIRTETAELEKLKLELQELMAARYEADEEKLYNLAKIYDGMNPVQLAGVMSGINDSIVVEILPRMKSQKASKILESMSADRAARISTKLLGKK